MLEHFRVLTQCSSVAPHCFEWWFWPECGVHLCLSLAVSLSILLSIFQPERTLSGVPTWTDGLSWAFEASAETGACSKGNPMSFSEGIPFKNSKTDDSCQSFWASDSFACRSPPFAFFALRVVLLVSRECGKEPRNWSP